MSVQETEMLIDSYKKEYLRANGRPVMAINKNGPAWIDITYSKKNGSYVQHWRAADLRRALETLKKRPDFNLENNLLEN